MKLKVIIKYNSLGTPTNPLIQNLASATIRGNPHDA